MAIAIGGLVAGILDLAAAMAITLYYGGSVTRMLQGIASGALGAAAFQGGVATAVLGAAFHFLIAFTAAAVFYLASRRIAFLTAQPVVAGVLYLVVQRVAGLHPKFTPLTVSRAVLVHIFCVGLPISLSRT